MKLKRNLIVSSILLSCYYSIPIFFLSGGNETSCWCLAFEQNPSVFPLSVRKALAEKSKQINPPQIYSPVGWSNRAGTVLTPVHLKPGVYTADRPFYWNSIDVSCRMTVIELPSSSKKNKPDLWVHSPVALDGPTKAAIDNIGTVKYVVSPNYEHLKFVSEWYLAYPNAEFWGCPGLMERRQDIRWAGEIPAGYRPQGWKKNDEKGTEPDNFWDTETIECMHIDVEKNPFTGKPFFQEVVYYHKPTKTLMVTDLWWNYPKDRVPNKQYGRDDTWELAPLVDDIPLGSRAWGFGMDKIYHPFYDNFMVTNKQTYKDIAEHITYKWDIETIVPAHGDLVRGKEFCTKILKEHFNLD